MAEEQLVRGLTSTDPAGPNEDRLEHAQVAEVVADVAMHAPTGSNIALYGRWGSGKSSIGKAVRALVEKQGVKFAYYDAFKWVDTPLHRSFLTVVGDELGQGDKVRGLYQSTSTKHLDLDWDESKESIRAAIKVMALALIGLALAAVLVEVAVRGMPDGAWRDAFANLVRPALLVGFLVWLLKQLIPSLLKTLDLDVKTDAPSSGEQFESIFETIIEGATEDGSQVVVFVDELDRCGPNEVVNTLNTIRTFVGINNVVTIVAADREALEAAIEREIPQETPRDPDHPYYSSGGAVLDKVFSHTIDIPPPLPETLVRFAIDVAEQAGGVWTQVNDLQRVVSVLIPTHVRSPRRVKALLNAYAVAYTLMQRRMAEVPPAVHGTPSERELELAKLVCLNVEYPIFARQLAEDDGLTEFVLNAGTSLVAKASRVERLQARARAIVTGEMPSRTSISRTVATADNKAPADDDTNEASSDDDTTSTPEPEDPSEQTPERVDANELVAYLQRTRAIPGPYADLIHLRGVGTTFGLPAGTARDLRNSALTSGPEAFRRRVSDLPADEQAAALKSLASYLGRTRGIDTDNLITAMLTAVRTWEEDELREVADDLTRAMIWALHEATLTTEQRAAALQLVMLSSESGREQHVKDLIADIDLTKEPRLASKLVMATAGHAEVRLQEFLPVAVATSLLNKQVASATAAALRRHDRDDLVTAAHPYLDEAIANRADIEEEEEEENPDRDELLHTLEANIEAFGPSAASRTMLGAILAIDHQSARNIAQSHLEALSPISESHVASRVTKAALRRNPATKWIKSVAWDSLEPGEATEILEQQVLWFWQQADNNGATSAQRKWANALAEAAESVSPTKISMAPSGFDAHFASNDALSWGPPLAAALEDGGLADVEAVGEALASILKTEVTRQPPNPPAANLPDFQQAHRDAVNDRLPALRMAARAGHAADVLQAAASNAHIPDDVTLALEINVAAQQEQDPLEVAAPEDVAAAVAAGLADAPAVLGPWFTHPGRTLDAMLDGLGPIADGRKKQDQFALLAAWSRRASEAGNAELLLKVVSGHLPDATIGHVATDRVDQTAFAQGLASAMGDDSTLAQKASALKAWDALTITDHGVRSILVPGVFFFVMESAAQGGKGDAELVRKHLDLLNHPTKPKNTAATARALAERIVAKHPKDEKLGDALKASGLVSAGLVSELLDRLGRR